MNIAVIGAGYVGLSVATLLAQNNRVIAVDILPEIIQKINKRISPIKDKEIEEYFKNCNLDLTATLNIDYAIAESNYIIISTPTNYDEDKNYFDTSSVESVIERISIVNSDAVIIIKSTIPVGFTEKSKKRFNNKNIIFSPEFLREGSALYDNLYPSRIIIGEKSERAEKFAELLCQGAKKEKISVLYTNNNEAEAIKLFANTYLAMRVAFFNELDTYSETCSLDSKEIITGVCLDPRIGDHYNNPSFGYGGYCLPKDTKQLLANYKKVPNDLIKAIVESNKTRCNHIVQMIIKRKPKIIGIYRLTMKTGSDNFRSSAIQNIMNKCKQLGYNIIIFEPTINKDVFQGFQVKNNFNEFKNMSDVIVANRVNKELNDVKEKVYSRDIFGKD
ncbi:MAG: nucleotide sugar dehydrogenase [Erysipelotrichaceae bacterium]